jgi:Ca2+/Na+ antiporter
MTGWNLLIWFGLPYSILGPPSWFLPYEVFYPKRIRKSRMFQVKKFARRTLSMFAVILSFFAATFFSEVYFSETLGINAFLPGMIVFVLVFFAFVFLWLRRQNSRNQWREHV